MKRNDEARATELRRGIGVDARATRDALFMLADYLERGEPLPKPLASALASIFRSAMEKPNGERAAALTYELSLTAPAKIGPPETFVNKHDLFRTVAMFGDSFSGRALARQLGIAYGLKDTRAGWHVKQAKERVRECRLQLAGIMAANGLSSLIDPRKSASTE